jgi:hypothetical protein
LGIASFNGFFLAIFKPFYSLAAFTPDVAQGFLRGPFNFLGTYLAIVVGPLNNIAVKICSFIDAKFKYPSQRGAVYSSVLGLTREDGCQLAFERDDKWKVSCLFRRCTVDRLLGICGLGIEVTCGFLAWSIAGSAHIKMKRLAGAVGFFWAFALLHVLRSVIKALTDTTITLYVEDSDVVNEAMKEDDRRRFESLYEQVDDHGLDSQANPLTQSLLGSAAYEE